MKKTTIRPVIVKSKALKDGTHKIRISVAHNNETKYILTNIIVPSEKNIRKGEVIGLPNASAINRKLRKQIDEYYGICDTVKGIEHVSCGQLVEILQDGGMENHQTFKDIAEEWIAVNIRAKDSTKELYATHIKKFLAYIGEDLLMASLSPMMIARYIKYMKSLGNSDMTIRSNLTTLRCAVRFATEKRQYVSFRVNPFVDCPLPPSSAREVTLSIDELRTFRDYPFTKKNHLMMQGYFMLSFYMCGMNMCDLIKVDFSKPVLKFKRQKTENRTPNGRWVVFSISKEAREIEESGVLRLRDTKTRDKARYIQSLSTSNLDNMRKMAIPDCERLIYYSARKTFAQISADLGICDAIIEYCIGDSQSIKKSIDYYRHVTQEMADNAIRLVLDFVASDKSIREFKKERNLI